MSIEQAVTDYLETKEPVTNIVGTRIYQLKMPQGESRLSLRVQLISDPRDYHLRGEQALRRARLQIDSYGPEKLTTGSTDPYAAVNALADAVDAALSGVRFVIDSIRVTGAFQILRRALHEPGTTPLIRIHQDFRLRYERVS